MFNNVNRFALCLTALVAVTNVHASEYVVDGASEEVYAIVTKYRIPSILSTYTQDEFKQRYPNRDVIETLKTKQSEFQFIKQAVNAVQPDTQVFTVPKSLYQLIAYTYMSNISTKHLFKDKEWAQISKIVHQVKKLFYLEDYVKKEENSITKACSYFIQKQKVKELFWSINKFAIKLLKENKFNEEAILDYLLDQFKKRTDECSFDDVQKLYQNPMMEALTKHEASDSCFKSTDDYEKAQSEVKEFIKNILKCERNCENYVLYRGGSMKLELDKALRTTVCYSDGLFGGILDNGGSALEIAWKSRRRYAQEG